MPEAKSKINTYNHDVAGICTRVHRFSIELKKSASGGTSHVNAFDQARLASYLNSIDVYVDWIVSQPQLDLPESHPKLYEIPLLPDDDVDSIENESLRDCVRMLQIGIIEMSSSQSSRQASGLISFDEARCRALVQKIRALLENYISGVDPLDLPESSPSYVMAGPGKTGV